VPPEGITPLPQPVGPSGPRADRRRVIEPSGPLLPTGQPVEPRPPRPDPTRSGRSGARVGRHPGLVGGPGPRRSRPAQRDGSGDVPISIFIRGKQEIQLTGRKPVPGGPTWSAQAVDPSIVQVTVQPVEIGPFPVEYWELTVTGLKIGNTQVHVQETQATHPIKVLYDFILDVTVLGLLA
jgi:hypothetical protein